MGIEQGVFSLPLEDAYGKDRQRLQSNARLIRAWMKTLSKGEVREFRLQRSRALSLMQLDNRHHFAAWSQSFSNPEDPSFRSTVYTDADKALAKNFGIPPTEITPTLERYADGSNISVTLPREKMPKDVSGRFEMVNEAELNAHPVDLLSIVFDPTYSNKAHFEALRKLNHMEADAEVEGDPVLIRKHEDYIKFTKILNEHVWMKDRKTGAISEAYFLSTHDPGNDFQCTSVEVIEMDFAEADRLSEQLLPNQKLVVASRRQFEVQSGPQKGRIVNIYISNRLKTSVDRRIKSERKDNGEDPHNSNRDAIGARIVADTKDELGLFIDHLRFVADKIGSDIKIHDYQDSISGGDFDGDNPGSSPDVQMIKFLVRIANIELEMQAFESIGFANASFKSGPSHSEYWWNRLFNSGWFSRNFPPSIYHYDPTALHRRLIRHERELIEGKLVQNQATLNPTDSIEPDQIHVLEQTTPAAPPTYIGRLLARVSVNATTALDHARKYLRS